jgi:ABC-2 type transport system ATP-binding protein
VQHRGTVGQYTAVDEMLTGQENLELVGRLYLLGPGERGSGPGGQFQLADAADRPVRTYSAARSGGPARMNKWRF